MEATNLLHKRFHNSFYIPCGDGPPGHKRPNYNYCEFNFLPAPAGVFGGLFTILVSIHIYLATRYRSRISWSVCTAAVLSAIAYWVKLINAAAAPEMHELTVVWTGLSFLAVFFINIYMYTLLHRLRITYLPATPIPSKPRPSRKLLYSLLGVEFFLPFGFQIAGLALLFSFGFYYDGMENAHAYVGFFPGFIIQLLNYVIFIGFLLQFHHRANKHHRTLKHNSHHNQIRSSLEGGSPRPRLADNERRDYQPMVFTLYAATALLGIRAIYYLINTGTGATFFPGLLHFPDYAYKSSYGLDKEWTFKFYEPGQLGLDAGPVFLSLCVLAWLRGYAGRVLREGRREKAGERETVWDRERGVDLALGLQWRRVEEMISGEEEHVANGRPPMKA